MLGCYAPQPESADTPIEAAFRRRARQLADDLKTEARRVLLTVETAPHRHAVAVLVHVVDRLAHTAERIRRAADAEFPGPFPEPFRGYCADLYDFARSAREGRLYGDVDVLTDLAKELHVIDMGWPNMVGWEFLRGAALREARAVWGR